MRTLSCARCTMPVEEVVRGGETRLIHTGRPTDGWEYHTPELGEQPAREEAPPSPAERTAAALERIADSLEKLQRRFYEP